MRIIDLSKVHGEDAGIMAFGFFDSIHLGHQKVIREAVRLSRGIGSNASVFLFKNNIYPLLGIEKYPIYTFSERIDLIQSLGIDTVYYIDADLDYLSLSPDDFLRDLADRVKLAGFTCGSDFTFGAKGKGTVQDLIRLIGGRYTVSDLLELDGEKVSTDRIKAGLRAGDLESASLCLGRPFSLRRAVLHGRNDGSKIGFPTVNVDLLTVPLRDGVYFTTVSFDDKCYRSVTNVGAHPTFADSKRNIESYLLDFKGDLYGREIEITFLHYQREISQFGRLQDLVDRIEMDVRERREYD